MQTLKTARQMQDRDNRQGQDWAVLSLLSTLVAQTTSQNTATLNA